jgi:hypothetical protein
MANDRYPKGATSPIPDQNAQAALLQTKMNIRILAMKHAKAIMGMTAHKLEAQLDAVSLVASASIIEDYLLQGIITPATIGAEAENTKQVTN